MVRSDWHCQHQLLVERHWQMVKTVLCHKCSGNFPFQISLDLSSSDKFCSFVRTTLDVLAQLLEIATLFDVGKHADEILHYFKSTVVLEPTSTVLCVQQVCVRVCECACAHVCVCVYVCMCVSVSVSVYLSACLFTHMYLCMCVCVYVYVCVHPTCVCVCVCGQPHKCVPALCVHAQTHMHGCMHVHICVKV